VNSKLSKIDNLITEDLNTPLELEFQDNSVLIELLWNKRPESNFFRRQISYSNYKERE